MKEHDNIHAAIKGIVDLKKDEVAACRIPDMTVHCVKILPVYFDAVAAGIKPFETRYDDRNYKVGDFMYLREWIPGGRKAGFTGKAVIVEITYKLGEHTGHIFGITEGHCVLGIRHKWKVAITCK